MIKSLAETGRLAEAQAVILDELSKQYGGQAAAAVRTFGGEAKQLANAWGDLKEEFGAVIAEFLPPLVEGLRTVVDWLQQTSPETKRFAVVVAGLAPPWAPCWSASA